MDEDMILPEDFEVETATPQADEITEQQEEVVEETPTEQQPQEQTENVEQLQEQPKIRVKYNHEERELTLEEATLLAQKGMNYDKLTEKLRSFETDPRLSFVEQQARKYNMSPDEYIQAVQKQEEQEQLNQLIQANIPEEYAREMLESRKFREQLQAKEQAKAAEEKQNAEFKDFLQTFSNVKPEEIPKEVWELNSQGVPLKYAYMEHQFKQQQNKIKVLETNLSNKSKAPVASVTSHGSTEVAEEDDFLKGFNSI